MVGAPDEKLGTPGVDITMQRRNYPDRNSVSTKGNSDSRSAGQNQLHSSGVGVKARRNGVDAGAGTVGSSSIPGHMPSRRPLYYQRKTIIIQKWKKGGEKRRKNFFAKSIRRRWGNRPYLVYFRAPKNPRRTQGKRGLKGGGRTIKGGQGF